MSDIVLKDDKSWDRTVNPENQMTNGAEVVLTIETFGKAISDFSIKQRIRPELDLK